MNNQASTNPSADRDSSGGQNEQSANSKTENASASGTASNAQNKQGNYKGTDSAGHYANDNDLYQESLDYYKRKNA